MSTPSDVCLARFHARAAGGDIISEFGTVELIRRNVEENFVQARASLRRLAGEAMELEVEQRQLAFLDTHGKLFERRIEGGHIRDGHGDLRLEHVYLVGETRRPEARVGCGEPIIIDCIEFNERFRFADVCADLAFLSMDLGWHGRHDLKERLLATYVRETGDHDPDLEPVRRAARAVALAEDRSIFHGYPAANITGIFEASAENSLTLTRDYQKYPVVVSEALARLNANGVGGPYAIALGPDCYKGLTGTASSGGYPVLEHVQRLINGAVFWAPGVRGALLASLRGGDFELVIGRDLSIGYDSHSNDAVRLYLQESLTFRVLSPEAAVPLVYR